MKERQQHSLKSDLIVGIGGLGLAMAASAGIIVGAFVEQNKKHGSSTTSHDRPEVVCRQDEPGIKTCSAEPKCLDLFQELRKGKEITIDSFQEACFKDNTFTITDWK